MKAPLNRRVFVAGYAAATPLGSRFEDTWKRAVQGDAGFRKVTRCEVASTCNVVGEIPDWNPSELDFTDQREVSNWNAAFVILTMAVSRDALKHAGLEITPEIAGLTASMIGSAINGHDAFRVAMTNLAERGPNRVSPFLLPNLCANLPGGKAGILLGYTGPVFSPQGACASGNHATGIASRMIRDGELEFALVGGVDMPIMPEIIHGFANMNATVKVTEKDRAFLDPGQASRPFSRDRKGFVLSEGCGVLVLASEDAIKAHGLTAYAEVLGIGWSSDAYHFTRPNQPTIVQAIRQALDDAELKPEDIQYINAHGTSTSKGDSNEVACLREVFGERLSKIPVSSNKSQLGHTLGASAAIEAALSIHGMRQGMILPTINHLPDPDFDELDVVPDEARKLSVELMISNAFGFGGTNCCVVFRGV